MKYLAEVRTQIAELGMRLFDRYLTDTAGGNIGVRQGELIALTPRYAGALHHWRIHSEQVLVFDLEGNQLEGEGIISRESKVHFRLLRQHYPAASAVVHCHARHVVALGSFLEEPMLPVLESTLKFGAVPLARYAPSHTDELAEYVAEQFADTEERVRKQAAAVIAPFHGLFVLGKDLLAAFDAAERLEVNAVAILSNPLWYREGTAAMRAQHQRAAAIINGFKEKSSAE